MKIGKVPKSVKRQQPKGGSRKGAPNKVTKELKDMILGALASAGGQTYLTACAKDPKLAAAFLSLIGKVLPTTLTGAGKNGEITFAVIERVIVHA